MSENVEVSKIFRRRLPHIAPKGRPIFVTWRLTGAMPPGVAFAIRNELKLTAGERFARNDAYLDARKRGPQFLKNERLAENVCCAIEHGAKPDVRQYELHEFVVMPNHVHVLVTPIVEMKEIMRNLKGVTANFANQLLGLRKNSFWQKDYYDHFCRDPKEFANIRRYIAMNPVKARFVARPEDWKWSSAGRRVAALSAIRARVASNAAGFLP
jgi:REP element-mobilizing transposase RayT